MKKDIIFYALSTAVNKGAILLFFPILTQFLTLEDFGKWSLVIIVSNLLVPIMSLNGAASILREGSSNVSIGLLIYKKYIYILVPMGLVLSFFFFNNYDTSNWLIYSIFIAYAEGVLTLSLTYLRTEEKALLYFMVSLFKMLMLFTMIFYMKEQEASLNTLFMYHFFVVLMFAFGLTLFVLMNYKYHIVATQFKPVFIFAIMLIPHSLSQWIMSSSDRIILENMVGLASVGIYSLAYNMALILMLINSGIALTLPTFMIKNFEDWKTKEYDNKLITYYTIVSTVLLGIVLLVYLFDLKYSRVLGYYGEEMMPLIVIIYTSIYILGLYYFYANYLFYYKKANVISKTTLKAASLNIILTVIFIYIWGVLGAAIATGITYLYYLYMIRREALGIDSTIKIKVGKNISLFFITSSILYYLGVCFV